MSFIGRYLQFLFLWSTQNWSWSIWKHLSPCNEWAEIERAGRRGNFNWSKIMKIMVQQHLSLSRENYFLEFFPTPSCDKCQLSSLLLFSSVAQSGAELKLVWTWTNLVNNDVPAHTDHWFISGYYWAQGHYVELLKMIIVSFMIRILGYFWIFRKFELMLVIEYLCNILRTSLRRGDIKSLFLFLVTSTETHVSIFVRQSEWGHISHSESDVRMDLGGPHSASCRTGPAHV